MPAYYSEFDPKAAAWLRELIKRGLIADGVVDERDLWDVAPAELAGFTQVHLCAGIGVWSYALRQAGWPDDRPCWTGSFPCQPFSAAGKGEGFADERHLWPAGQWLIEQCRPAVVFGEQVASKDAEPWIDLVQADLEALGYAVGAVPFPSAGVGAPHIRDRLYWVAQSGGERQPRERLRIQSGRSLEGHAEARWGGEDGIMANDARPQGRVERGDGPEQRPAGPGSVAGGLGHARRERDEPRRGVGDVGRAAGSEQGQAQERERGRDAAGNPVADGTPGPTNGLWRDADWLFCRDGKWRPVRPGAQQMVDGSTASLGRLRDSRIREIETVVEEWSKRHQRDGTQAVRDLWDLLSSEEADQRADGGFDSVREAPFLLAFLRQLSDQGWRFPIGDERSGSKASRTALRVLRFDKHAAYSSRGRGLDEQRPGEPADPVRELSQIVAHYTEVCWGLSGWQNVGSFPLVVGAEARVSRLRGYGNAINAEAAQVFIESYLEACG